MKRFLLFAGVVAALALTAGAIVLSYVSTRGEREMVGVVAAPGAVVLEVADQLGAQGALTVARVSVPEPSWIAVYTEGMGGMPGRRAGLVAIPPGESRGVRVSFDPEVRLSENAIVVVHADRGVPGTFEFDDARFEASPDKPYWVRGETVRTDVWVRYFEMGNAFRS